MLRRLKSLKGCKASLTGVKNRPVDFHPERRRRRRSVSVSLEAPSSRVTLPAGACGHLYSSIPQRKEPDLNKVPTTSLDRTYVRRVSAGLAGLLRDEQKVGDASD